MKLIYSILVLLIGLSSTVEAKMYRWVDANGKVHYSDRKPVGKKLTKSKEVTIRVAGRSMPNVDINSPIPYKKSTPSQKVSFDSLELKLVGASYDDVKIGRVYSGRSCSRKEADLIWTDGNGFFDNARLDRLFLSEFNRSGYRLVDEDSALNIDFKNRLKLKAKLVTIKINSCRKGGRHSTHTSNDVYLKIDWLLEDSLSKKELYSGISEGIYKGISKPARKNGTPQAISRALTVAINNVLANRVLTRALGKVDSSMSTKNATDTINIKYKYSANTKSFKSKLKRLQKSTVTIRTPEGHGSGVFISGDGYILTNAHVVKGSRQVLVILDDEELEATVIRIEPIRDVALLKTIRRTRITSSKLSTTKPEVGDRIYVIGTPLSESLSHTVTSGIISAMRLRNELSFYQTDASINKGNSGGPVYNEFGELVAISVSGMLTKSGAGLGLNYLIPINDALDSLNITRTNTKKRTYKKTSPKRTASYQKKTPKEANLEIFDLYQKALRAKQRGQLNTAKGMLTRAVAYIPSSNKTSSSKEVRDELYYYLPIAYAKKAIQDKNLESIEKHLAPLNSYIKNHSKRFEFTKEISSIREASDYLKKALKMGSTVNGQIELGYIRIFMREYYARTGDLPKSIGGLSTILDDEFGHRLSNSYDLEDYQLDANHFTIVFTDIKTGNEITIEGRI